MNEELILLIAKLALDAGVLVIMILSVIQCARRGFIMSLYRLFRWVLCILLTGWLYPYVAEFLKETGLLELFSARIENGLMRHFAQEAGELGERLIPALPFADFFRRILEINNTEVVREVLRAGTTVYAYVASYLANIIINILSILIVLFGTRLILVLLGKLLKVAGRLPVIRTLNGFLGAIIGIFYGVFWVFVLGLAVYLVACFCDFPWLSSAASEARLFSWANEYNFILKTAMTFAGFWG